MGHKERDWEVLKALDSPIATTWIFAQQLKPTIQANRASAWVASRSAFKVNT